MPIRRPLQPGERILNPRWQRELRRANHLLNVGQHSSAAEIFLSLAQRAGDGGIMEPAAFLFLQAGRAALFAEDFKSAFEHARTGLDMLAEQGRWLALRREGERFAEGLEDAGQAEAAAELQEWLQRSLAAVDPAQATVAQEPPPGRLPEKCPYCGASMSLEQVSARAAECQYCGSVVVAE
jgi:hypothetical protein